MRPLRVVWISFGLRRTQALQRLGELEIVGFWRSNEQLKRLRKCNDADFGG